VAHGSAALAAIIIVHDAKMAKRTTCRIRSERTIAHRAFNGAPDSGAKRDASDP